jgi:hypothetical protein
MAQLQVILIVVMVIGVALGGAYLAYENWKHSVAHWQPGVDESNLDGYVTMAMALGLNYGGDEVGFPEEDLMAHYTRGVADDQELGFFDWLNPTDVDQAAMAMFNDYMVRFTLEDTATTWKLSEESWSESWIWTQREVGGIDWTVTFLKTRPFYVIEQTQFYSQFELFKIVDGEQILMDELHVVWTVHYYAI